MVDSQKRLKIDRDDLKILRREIRKREQQSSEVESYNEIKVMESEENNKKLEEIRSKLWKKKLLTISISTKQEIIDSIMRTSLISLIEQEEIQWETRAENWPSKEKNFIILLLQLTIAAHKNCKIRVKMKQNKKLCEKAEGIYKLEWRKNVSQQIQDGECGKHLYLGKVFNLSSRP